MIQLNPAQGYEPRSCKASWRFLTSDRLPTAPGTKCRRVNRPLNRTIGRAITRASAYAAGYCQRCSRVSAGDVLSRARSSRLEVTGIAIAQRPRTNARGLTTLAWPRCRRRSTPQIGRVAEATELPFFRRLTGRSSVLIGCAGCDKCHWKHTSEASPAWFARSHNSRSQNENQLHREGATGTEPKRRALAAFEIVLPACTYMDTLRLQMLDGLPTAPRR